MRLVWRFLFIDSDVKSRYEKEGLFERRSVCLKVREYLVRGGIV
jgi:hypothetical protein